MGRIEAEVFPAIVFVCALFLCVAIVVSLFTFFVSKRLSKAELAKKQLEVSYQQDLLHQTLLAQEKDRNRIAQDIHDEIGSKLSVINLYAQLLYGNCPAGSEMYELASKIHEQGKTISENARRIAYNLMPLSLESFGLKAALEEYLHQVNNSQAIQIHFQTNTQLNQLNAEQQTHIFRIVQELINNSIRHGQASIATLNIDLKENICYCNYDDDGKGYDPLLKQTLGIGLKSIKSRIQFMQGIMSVTSGLNKGFKIDFEFAWK